MADKTSVTVPLTARQKEQIKKMTGQTISALKVESAGGATLAKNAHMLAGRSLARKTMARKTLSRKVAAKSLAKNVAAKTLAKAVAAKTLARVVAAKTIS